MELITGHKARKWQNRDSNLHLGSLRPGPGGTWTHPLTHTHTHRTRPRGADPPGLRGGTGRGGGRSGPPGGSAKPCCWDSRGRQHESSGETGTWRRSRCSIQWREPPVPWAMRTDWGSPTGPRLR